MKREGQIRVDSENLFPIIKKWLYSDKDIFLREIVANGYLTQLGLGHDNQFNHFILR